MKCDNPNLRSPSFSAITEDDGLISNNVSSIYVDAGGNLWFGTNRGVSKYDGENFQNIPLDYLIRPTVHTIFEDSKGSMWFVTTHYGVSKYIPPAKGIRPRVHIAQIEADRIYYDVDNIRVSNTVKRITFEYKGISFRTRPGKMRYTYQLEGYDSEWRSRRDSTRVYYESLTPGRYKFKVSAIDEDLHRSEPATVEIVVFRPWYLTGQFIVAVILVGVCVIGGGGYLGFQFTQLRVKLRRQENIERIQTAKMSSLRQLVARITHEINNPIGVISSNSDTLSRTVNRINSLLTQEHSQEGAISKDLTKLLSVLRTTGEMSQSASERIANIISDLRNFVRLDEGEWKEADIHEGMDNAIALLGLEDKVRKNYGDFQKVCCLPGSLNQVFYGILKNASEAIDSDGEISVKTSVQGEYAKIEISDTGMGIPPENLDKIFDLDFTTKSMGIGVGLGLPICKQIIEVDHKGHIYVSSKPGEETTFTIWLPLHSDEEEK
jgi:signal transduction histidine kinase